MLLLCQLKLFLTYACFCSLVYFILVYILVYFYFIFFLFSIPLLGFLSLIFIASGNKYFHKFFHGSCFDRVQNTSVHLSCTEAATRGVLWKKVKFHKIHTWSILNMHFKLLISITTRVSNYKIWCKLYYKTFQKCTLIYSKWTVSSKKYIVKKIHSWIISKSSQPTIITCSKLTIETVEQGVKYVQS